VRQDDIVPFILLLKEYQPCGNHLLLDGNGNCNLINEIGFRQLATNLGGKFSLETIQSFLQAYNSHKMGESYKQSMKAVLIDKKQLCYDREQISVPEPSGLPTNFIPKMVIKMIQTKPSDNHIYITIQGEYLNSCTQINFKYAEKSTNQIVEKRTIDFKKSEKLINVEFQLNRIVSSKVIVEIINGYEWISKELIFNFRKVALLGQANAGLDVL
jgi:hypothetical protein